MPEVYEKAERFGTRNTDGGLALGEGGRPYPVSLEDEMMRWVGRTSRFIGLGLGS